MARCFMNKYEIARVEADNTSEVIGTPKKAFFWVCPDQAMAVCNLLNSHVCREHTDCKHYYEVRPCLGNGIKNV